MTTAVGRATGRSRKTRLLSFSPSAKGDCRGEVLLAGNSRLLTAIGDEPHGTNRIVAATGLLYV